MIANLPECVALPLDHPYANNDILDMRDLKNEKFIAMARSISCSGFESIIQNRWRRALRHRSWRR